MDISYERSFNTPASMSPLLPLLLLSLAKQRHAPHTTTCLKKEYDYIVVGGGSAGSIVASRLSEEPCNKVLLLEAGRLPPLLTEVPGYAYYFLGTSVDWQYKTVPQKYSAFAQETRQVHLPAGKMLGGSGNHNHLNYVRGNHRDFDDWAAQGAKGWSYDEVLPYFKKMEDFVVLDPHHQLSGHHAHGGPVTVDFPHDPAKVKGGLAAAITEAGYQQRDINSAKTTGVFNIYSNVRDDQRCSSVKAYLVPAENRTNLDIFVNSVVTKVIIEGNEAKGVELFHEGQFMTVRARREVILCAGTLNTPKILMLSGIGPREELLKFNIPVIADLPVGKNYHDHPASTYYFVTTTTDHTLPEKLGDPTFIQTYIASRLGPLASASGTYFSAFLNGLKKTPADELPSVFVIFRELTKKPSMGSMRPEVYDQLIKPYENASLCSCHAMDPHPKSRGTVTLSSPNPFDPPVIDPNYLAHPSDVHNIVTGIKLCQRILDTVSLKALGGKAFETKVPDCELLSGDAYLSCYVRALVFSGSHHVGTCKMGDPNDPSTVVDPQLRVKYIDRLRVVDASIMPSVTTGNTNVPTMMIAEKASDIIKSSKPPKNKSN